MNVNRSKKMGWGPVLGLLFLSVGAVGALMVSCTAKVTPTSANVGFPALSPGQAGSIAFTGMMTNGNSQFSFVSTTNFPAGVTIYFSDYSYDKTANSGQGGLVDESTNATASSNWPGVLGAISWQANMATTISETTTTYVTGSSGLTAYNEVVLGTGSLANVLQGGTSPGGLTLNHNGAGHKILAWVGAPVTIGQPISASVTFVAALMFGPDTWASSGSIGQYKFWDSYLPPGLDITTTTDLSNNWNTAGLSADNTASAQNVNAVLSTCSTNLQSVINPVNWSVDGNESKTKVGLPNLIVSPCNNGVGFMNLP